MINLNDSEFDQKEGGSVVIFNKGVAGVAENVKISLTKKKKEDNENAPDYKIVFTDSEGGTANMSFYYITEDTQYSTIQQQTVKQGKVLKHLIHATLGKDYKFPEFNTPKEMLDICLKTLKEKANPAGLYRVFVNYGTTGYPKKYIQPRSWVPFMEPMSVTESRLTVSDLDCMTRPQPDNANTSGPVANADDLVNDDWD